MGKTRKLAVLIPCLNEAEVIGETLRRVEQATAGCKGWETEIIVIDDGSNDPTASIVNGYNGSMGAATVSLVRLSRQFGHQAALAAGLDASDADATAIIDADLQDPPELLPEMLALLDEGFDVVYGERDQREGANWWRRLGYSGFYKLMKVLVGEVEIPAHVGDFRVMNKQVTKALRAFPEKQRFLRGLVPYVGFHQTGIRYSRPARHAGETKYSLTKLTSLALEGLVSFSSRPLRLALWSGLVMVVLSGLGIVTVLVIRLATDIWAPGWATITSLILGFGGIQLFFIGVLGEYLGRVFLEVKGRPAYVVRGDSSDNHPS